ncbi:MAG: TonB-dependent receptor [Gammaproteobacteria bacterium]|nr:TonB-dependent receptor [Gammaproteobacteria bacterium]
MKKKHFVLGHLIKAISAFLIRVPIGLGGCTLILLLIHLPAWAIEPIKDSNNLDALIDMSLEELVEVEISLATGSPKDIRSAPAVATVITAKDIERIGATTLDEALETVAGLHVGVSTLSRTDSVYSIRGIQTGFNPQTLMLIDGIPLSILFTGGRPSTFRLPVESISRIEVIRGPGSAIYGADAFSGVINIITKNGREINGFTTGGRYGSFNSYDAWLQHGENYMGWDVALSLEYQQSDGDRGRIVDADLQTMLDGKLGTASLAPGPLERDYKILNTNLKATKGNWVIGFWSWLQNDAGEGAGIGQALDPVGTENVDLYLADVSYRNDELVRDWDLGLRLYYLYNKNDSKFMLFPPGATLPIGSNGNFDFFTPNVPVVTFTDGAFGAPIIIDKQSSIDFTAFYSGFNKHYLRIGAGYKLLKEDTEERKNYGPGVLDGTEGAVDGTLTDVTDTKYVFMGNQSRKLWFISLQDEWSLARRWELTAGVRYDAYSDFGHSINPRAALVWETRNDLNTKLLYGRAFRPPSFSELYLQNNPTAVGNENLDPETIETLELVFDYKPTSHLRTILSLFYYDVEGLIDFVEDPGGTKTAQNYKNQKGHGLEVELDWDITNKLSLRSNFAYQRSKDKDSGEITPDAPEMQFYINPYWTFLPDWSVDSQFYWIAGRHRAAADTRPDIKDYSLVNLTLRRKNIDKHWDMAFAIRNLFDENIREPSDGKIPNDYPMKGRNLWAEVRYKF